MVPAREDSGVELLCDRLKSAPCRLETLRLSGCLVSQRGGAALASALSSAHSHLTELDLSYNHPGPSAELLTALRDDPHCPLDSLRLDPAGEQWMVPGLRKYSCEFSLDPNTAHRKLKLSEDKQTVTFVKEEQQYPDHEDRFTDCVQILSCTGLRGRCYWEVDWSGGGGRVSVLLDTEAGSLSFYHVDSDGKLFHLHTSSCSFTEPLFPGFGLISYNMDPPGPGPGSKPRPGPAPDSVSMRSDFSKDYPPDFTESRPEEQSFSKLQTETHLRFYDSYNMDPPGPGPGSKRRPGPGPGSKRRPGPGPGSKRRSGPAPDSVSMRSDWSKDFPPNFKEARPEEQRPKPAPDSVSMRSDWSKGHPLNFREAPPEDQREPGPKEQLDAIFRRLEKDVLTFVKEQLQRLHRLLASDYPECSESEEEEQSSREVLNITLDFLRRMDQEQLAQRLQHKTAVGVCKDKLKSHLQQRFSRVFEGVAKAGDSAPLNQIYTELYITEGGASEVNQEHEVRLMESAANQSVLTKGVAGVGKTVLTQKFSLDWAEGRANQELQLLFPFTFRELNVLRDTQFSLVELLHHFFSPSKALCSFQQLQVLFIFDGLDECRLPLDFRRTRVLTDPTESVSVDVLLVNLIRGSLLPPLSSG
ncbi:hypothetical protein WMY93_000117 [Mugilogobius chulae]|uniref:NACHT domain-containing protein n=1 Tax=Mugilogobius chulae TaxID=88201 RepID=A0AAW0QDE6_9GOBI